jgi:hypothetical protein
MADQLTLSKFLEFATDETTYLPALPTLNQLKLIRKGLRKKKIPDLSMLPNKFEYEGVGKFTKKLIDSDFLIEWQTEGGEMKKSSFSHLCSDVDKELDRLEFGWMVADFARMDAINHLSKMRPISYSDFHQNQFNKQYASQQKHFQKIENVWRHWAIVPACHMLFTE